MENFITYCKKVILLSLTLFTIFSGKGSGCKCENSSSSYSSPGNLGNKQSSSSPLASHSQPSVGQALSSQKTSSPESLLSPRNNGTAEKNLENFIKKSINILIDNILKSIKNKKSPNVEDFNTEKKILELYQKFKTESLFTLDASISQIEQTEIMASMLSTIWAKKLKILKNSQPRTLKFYKKEALLSYVIVLIDLFRHKDQNEIAEKIQKFEKSVLIYILEFEKEKNIKLLNLAHQLEESIRQKEEEISFLTREK